MRQLFVYIMALTVVLVGCTTAGERARMHAGLDSLNVLNRTDQPFTVQDVQPYVEFFDDHGTPNDRLLAHYLLGRAYYEHGEAPMALQCYHDALACADTTATDCDYAQLARVYAQMGGIFYEQGLYRDNLLCYQKSSKYAWKGKDTLTAIILHEKEGDAYTRMGIIDSAIIVVEEAYQQFNSYGYHVDAAISLGSVIRNLVDKGYYHQAKQYMDIYEKNSGWFDSLGNIGAGHAIYYKAKGLYYLYSDKLDSAEYFFRKELKEGRDFNNQNASATGLALLFQEKHQPDSSTKYALYAYAMLDSVYAQRTTEDVERLQAMYNYSRHQEIARKSLEEANKERLVKNYLSFLLFVILLLCIFFAIRLVKMRKERLEEFKRITNELNKVAAEKEALSKHRTEYEEMIAAKDAYIKEIKQKKAQYAKMTYFKTAIAEKCLNESPAYKSIEKKAIKGMSLTEEDITRVVVLIKEYLPGFEDFLTTKRSLLKEDEYHICILLRLHFRPVDISRMLGLSKSQISQASTKIMSALFETTGSSKKLSAKLCNIF